MDGKGPTLSYPNPLTADGIVKPSGRKRSYKRYKHFSQLFAGNSCYNILA